MRELLTIVTLLLVPACVADTEPPGPLDRELPHVCECTGLEGYYYCIGGTELEGLQVRGEAIFACQRDTGGAGECDCTCWVGGCRL